MCLPRFLYPFIHQWTPRFSRLGSCKWSSYEYGVQISFVSVFVTIWIYSQWASLVAQTVKNLPEMQATSVWSLGQEDHLKKGKGYPLQYSCIENPKDRRTWRAIVHGVSKSQTWLFNTSIIPEVQSLGHNGSSTFYFLRLHTVFHNYYTRLQSQQKCTFVLAFVICCLFDNRHGEVV